MLAVAGTYEYGHIKLDEEVPFRKRLRVIITFLEETEPQSSKGLSLSDFSFAASRKNTEGYKGSFSDTLIEERRRLLK